MYKSCHIIKHGLCFYWDKIVSCCYSPVDQVYGAIPPLIYGCYRGQLISKQELFKRMDRYVSVFKNGSCPYECNGCYHIEEKNWDEEHYIDFITITHFSKCNADCIYCANNCQKNLRTNNMYNILPVLKSFLEQGVIRKGGELHIGGGEFTIYKEADKILELLSLSNFLRTFVPTNAIKYSHNLFRAMNDASTYIIVSLDCGNRKLYKKIHRVDAFDKVIENLEKYALTEKSRESIRLKYIILPTINDSISEFKKFLKIAKSLGIRNIVIDIDARYSRMQEYSINSYFIRLAKRMDNVAVKQGFKTEFYSFLLQNINNKDFSGINIIKDIFTKINLMYFDKRFKKLYSSYYYGKIGNISS